MVAHPLGKRTVRKAMQVRPLSAPPSFEVEVLKLTTGWWRSGLTRLLESVGQRCPTAGSNPAYPCRYQ